MGVTESLRTMEGPMLLDGMQECLLCACSSTDFRTIRTLYLGTDGTNVI